MDFQDFSSGLAVKTSPSNAGGESSIPIWGAKISHATWPKKQSIKLKQCNKFDKSFHWKESKFKNK